MENQVNSPLNQTELSSDNNTLDESQIEQQIAHLQALADQKKLQQKQEFEQKQIQEKKQDLDTLTGYREELKVLEEMAGFEGKMSIQDARTLAADRLRLTNAIADIERKHGLTRQTPTPAVAQPEPAEVHTDHSIWPTIAKIAGVLIGCWLIVIFSGEYIVSKYPGAAIYNEVSFQKVLFGFSVFIAGIVAVVVALNVFLPGFGRYFNPFNSNRLDFYEDFKKLTEWQRTCIAAFLLALLLLSFVLTVAGKLD